LTHSFNNFLKRRTLLASFNFQHTNFIVWTIFFLSTFFWGNYYNFFLTSWNYCFKGKLKLSKTFEKFFKLFFSKSNDKNFLQECWFTTTMSQNQDWIKSYSAALFFFFFFLSFFYFVSLFVAVIKILWL